MTIWLTSDTHFGHANMLTFVDELTGERVRTFPSVEAMDETMVERWNAVVKPSDHVYHLGDVAIHRPMLQTVRRLHGKKRLVRGNHDIFRTREYIDVGFQEILGCRVFPHARVVFTHFPVHPSCLERGLRNVHGHIHQHPSPDGGYLNVCVEQTDYTPISLEDAVARLHA